MAKTGGEIQRDVYRLLQPLKGDASLTGEVYQDTEFRPRDSQLEDAVVIFTEGGGQSEQIQSGTVTVNIYVPDIDPYDNGVFVKDKQRTDELERAAADWVDTLTAELSCYHFQLKQAIYTEAEPSIKQHFVVVRLSYDYYGDDGSTVLTDNSGGVIEIEPKTEK